MDQTVKDNTIDTINTSSNDTDTINVSTNNDTNTINTSMYNDTINENNINQIINNAKFNENLKIYTTYFNNTEIIVKTKQGNIYLDNEYKILKIIRKKIKNNKIKGLNVPQMLYYHNNNNLNYTLLFEKIEGQDLLDYLLNNSPDNLTKLVIVYKIVKSVYELHKNSIAHGDIKLENILIKTLNVNKTCNEYNDIFNSIKISVIDFEFSSYKKINSFKTSGTDQYVSPELLYLRKFNTKANDVWGLGMLIYCIFANQYPYNIDEIKKCLLMYNQDTKYECFYKMCNNINYCVPECIANILKNIFTKQKERPILEKIIVLIENILIKIVDPNNKITINQEVFVSL